MSAGRHIKSQSRDWGTPLEYIQLVKNIFGGEIDLDPCSNEHSLVNAKIEYKLPQNGLQESWNFPKIYCNPPYGRNYENKTTIKDWLNLCTKANKEYNSEVIALVPVATNTRHWQNNILINATCICFLKVARLKFLQEGIPFNKGAPMACAIVYWGLSPNKFKTELKDYGIILDIT